MLEYKQLLIDLGQCDTTTKLNPFITGTYSSCVSDKTVVADEDSGVVKLNRRLYMELKPNNLFTHRNENDPLEKLMLRRIALRSVKPAEILTSKRKRGESNTNLVENAGEGSQESG